MAAAMALGAEGIVLSTRLLASHEVGIHEQYKNRILNAKETDTVYTDLFDKGWPNSYMRVLRNSTYDQWVKADKPPSGKRPGEHEIITQFCPGSSVERYDNEFHIYFISSIALKCTK